MSELSENYHLRKCFIERNQIPTQSMIRKKMGAPLAAVYFKSMTPSLKILAGLEPPMKGPGPNWYMPPQDILKSRSVLKPLQKECMDNLNWIGLDEIGMKLIQVYHSKMLVEKEQILESSNVKWRCLANEARQQQWDKKTNTETVANTELIKTAVSEFNVMYTTSLNKIQQVLMDAAVKEIKNYRKQVFEMMEEKFKPILHKQSMMLYDRYAKKLAKVKEDLKLKFINDLKKVHTKLGHRLHDIHLEKHVAVEKMRHLLKCQNVACQTYIVLKEQDHCFKEMQLTTHKYMKQTRALKKKMESIKNEIHIEQLKEKRRKEFDTIWKKKVCHIVKNFQMFVSYCLRMLPEHADFFINMEKLMLFQLNETWNNPEAQSIFIEEHFPNPEDKPHLPFYVFCEKSFKPNIAQDLCLKSVSSNTSHLPVIVVNKQCIYSACDNFEQFTDQIISYIGGKSGDDDADFEDNLDYSDVPVTYTASQQYRELKLESSLMQILQEEIAGIVETLPKKYRQGTDNFIQFEKDVNKTISIPSVSTDRKIESRSQELEHEREPKWQSYLRFIKGRKCECIKTFKKDLAAHLPSYMKSMSRYDKPELLNYEPCSVDELKSLVKEAQGKTDKPSPSIMSSYTKDVGVQYDDNEFNYLCNCYSDEDIHIFYKHVVDGNLHPLDLSSSDLTTFKVIGDTTSPSYLTKRKESFAIDRAVSLSRLIDPSGEVIKEIFLKADCSSVSTYPTIISVLDNSIL